MGGLAKRMEEKWQEILDICDDSCSEVFSGPSRTELRWKHLKSNPTHHILLQGKLETMNSERDSTTSAVLHFRDRLI